MTYGWPTVPEDVSEQVSACVQLLQQSIEGNIQGIYLHGSLAMGAFRPAISDIDILVVTHQPVGVARKITMTESFLELSKKPHPIEVSVLAQSYLEPWQFPPLYDFHFSEVWRPRYRAEQASGEWQFVDSPLPDVDLAAHIQILHEYGIALVGPNVQGVFPLVPKDDYLKAILGDVEEALATISLNPVYAVLNWCRVMAYISADKILSKVVAGNWALEALPSEFHEAIRLALAQYEGDARHSSVFEDGGEGAHEGADKTVNGTVDKTAMLTTQTLDTLTTFAEEASCLLVSSLRR